MSLQLRSYMEEAKSDKKHFEELKDHLEAFESTRDGKSKLTFDSTRSGMFDETRPRLPQLYEI